MESSHTSSYPWTRAQLTAAIAALALFLLLSGALPVHAAPTLRYQADLNGDFALIGNTLAWDCSGAVAPIVGTVGNCGNNTGDSGVDVYWRSQSPSAAQATASNAVTAGQNRTTAVLALPAGATVAYARLYWSAFRTTADTTATLEALGSATTLSVTADQSFTANQASQGRYYYQSTADVTDYVTTHGSGSYRVSGAAMANPVNDDEETSYSAWSLVVVYNDATAPLRNLAIFDGLDVVTPGNPASATLSGFLVPNAAFDAKLGVITYEGDQSVTGDALSFDGATLADAQNPINNFFNGTRSWQGSPITVAGDLPQLAGTPGSMSGFDLDVLDVTSLLDIGQTSAVIEASTTTDVFLLGAFVTSISTLRPDFSTTDKSVVDVNGGTVRIGDVLQYTVVAPNTGRVPALDTLLTDTLPAGVTFVPGSLAVTAGANAGAKTDVAGDDQGEYVEVSRTLLVRLGSGATESLGGTLAVGESTTVTFQVTYDGTVPGTIQNQAVVTATWKDGAPSLDWPSDGNGGGEGQPPTEIIPDTDGDGELDTTDCAPLDPATYHGALDAVCNGVDNDCDASTDEDFVSAPTVCGLGPCAATGETACVDGLPLDSCVPGTPAPSDTTCDGVDEDCTGVADDGYVPRPLTCGIGACERTTETSCTGGVETAACEPGQPTPEVCNGVDDDCNGKTDAADGGAMLENDQPFCEKQQGVCLNAKKTLAFCTGGKWKPCNDAIYRYWAPAYEPVEPSDCDAQDNDCDGSVDEAYVPVTTTCGQGACAAAGATSCVAGQVLDSCVIGAPLAADDVTCDGVDDDCSGAADEDYVPVTSCFLPGVCEAGNVASGCVAGLELGCVAGVPLAGDDVTCDGVDDDCSGAADEDYVPVISCFLPGACAIGNVASGCSAGVEIACTAGQPLALDDATCDGVDDDCDGSADEEFATHATTCGVGSCAAVGTATCEAGVALDTCVPGTPGDETCDGTDDNCDGVTDEGFADTDGDLVADCVDPDDDDDGDPDETDCAPLDPAVFAGQLEACNGLDDNCTGGIDEGFADVNGDGVPDCEAVDTDLDGDPDVSDCAPTDPTVFTGQDEACNGIDDNCADGIDEGFPDTDGDLSADCVDLDDDGDGDPDETDCAPTDSTVFTGQDEACNGIDDTCDGAVDEGFVDTDGDLSADCVDLDDDGDGDPDETDCAPLDATVFAAQVEACNGTDDDCDGGIDEGFVDTDGDLSADCVDFDDDQDGDPDETDCAPLDVAVFHGRVEVCNGVDDNCVDGVDEGFADTDGDGVANCELVDSDGDGDPDSTDCAPLDPQVFHGQAETCNGADENCDGVDDDGFVDTDDDGLADCVDADDDGDALEDSYEIELGFDPQDADMDDDGLLDGEEVIQGADGFVTDPLDADTDDDGLADGAEAELEDGFATNPTLADSDGDGLGDGLEQGVTEALAGGTSEGTGVAFRGTDPEVFVPDGDPATVTDPTNPDTDGGTVADGLEDLDHDGVVDEDETDPNDPADDVPDLDADDDGDPDATDCAPEDPAVFHGQDEACNGVDDDCDGAVDQGFVNTDLDDQADCVDADDDGDGDPDETDCAPLDAAVFHGQVETCNELDDDCDGTTDGDVCQQPDADDDGDPDATDCAPEDPAVFHGQTEVCNGVDDNCVDGVDEGFPTGCGPVDSDDDGDPDETDCAPNDAAIHHGATEACNGVDDTCDGETDEGFVDTDADGQADCVDADDDDDGDPDATDCARLDPAIHHGAAETCNGRDDDCDGKTDGAVCALPDADHDGDPDQTDCAPEDPAVHHGATEVCNGVDDNCADGIDEGFDDLDGDGTPDCTTGDTDDDGVLDDVDNCPGVANPDQDDLDGDGTGDACQAEGFSLTGGSCTLGGPGSMLAWWAILGLALGVLVLARRSLRGRLVALGLLLLSIVAGAPLARAEPMIDANRFKPSPFFQDGFAVESAEVRSPYRWNLGLFAHYQNDPLVLRSDGGAELRTVLGHQVMADVLGAYRFADFLAVGVALPVVLFQEGQGFGGRSAPETAGLGDLRVHPRLTFLRAGDVFALAFAPVFTLPTGRLTGRFAGRPNATFQPQLDASLFLGRVDVSLNVGYLLTKNETAAGLPLEDELLVKLGARVKVVRDELDLLAEASGAASVSDPFSSSRQTPFELVGGGLWHVIPGLDLAFGGGGGLTEGVAAPDFRLFAGLRWAPSPASAPAALAKPEPDTDGDGLKDSVDKCPLEPEDQDGFEDTEGCPDADNDKDGILDPWVVKQGLSDKYKTIGYGSDECPLEAEDGDYVDDDDGCPEPDNDGDLICDPWVAERGQQAKYAHACHGTDKCLMEPETVNDFEDEDGCPDSKVEVKGNKLVILDVILFYFNEARIKEESYVILDSVASVLKKEPDLKKVRVEGHTDTRGNAAANQKLSEARAKAVMEALVARGVEADRLTCQGFGESKPLVKVEKTEADFQKNRRVEFTILR